MRIANSEASGGRGARRASDPARTPIWIGYGHSKKFLGRRVCPRPLIGVDAVYFHELSPVGPENLVGRQDRRQKAVERRLAERRRKRPGREFCLVPREIGIRIRPSLSRPDAPYHRRDDSPCDGRERGYARRGCSDGAIRRPGRRLCPDGEQELPGLEDEVHGGHDASATTSIASGLEEGLSSALAGRWRCRKPRPPGHLQFGWVI